MPNRWGAHVSARYHCCWHPLDDQWLWLLFLPPTATVVSFSHQCQDISVIFHHMFQNSLGGSCHFHPRPPSVRPPQHQPSMVPKACSVLEEIFTFFSSYSETTVLACPDSCIFDGILLPVFIWNLFFIRTKTRDLPWWFRWILTQVLFITQHCSSPTLRLCLTFSFLEVSS